MSKTTNLYVRLESGLKEQAKLVLGQLDIPPSNAVNAFLKQVVMQRGILFDVKFPAIKPVALSDLNEIERNEELEKGYTDFIQGNTKSAEDIFSDI